MSRHTPRNVSPHALQCLATRLAMPRHTPRHASTLTSHRRRNHRRADANADEETPEGAPEAARASHSWDWRLSFILRVYWLQKPTLDNLEKNLQNTRINNSIHIFNRSFKASLLRWLLKNKDNFKQQHASQNDSVHCTACYSNTQKIHLN